MEGSDPVLDGSYWTRKNPNSKCAVAEIGAGYKVFAVQDGGWCASSATAPQTYDKYGRSDACLRLFHLCVFQTVISDTKLTISVF